MNRNSGPGFSTGIAAALVVAQIVPAGGISMAPAAAQNSVTVSCTSSNNSTRQCRVPENASSISYVGPDRSGRCQQGRTFGLNGNRMWVSGGCSGQFEIGLDSGWNNGGGWNGGNNGGGWNGGNNGGNWNDNGGGSIVCGNGGSSVQRCRVNTGGQVMLQQQLSGRCLQGETWTFDNSSITVRNGCRARFLYGSQAGNGWNSGSGYAGEIECRSDNNRQRRCSVQTNNRVTLLHRFSGNCTQGQDWYYDNNSISVRNGCEARFGYGYGNVKGDTGGGGTNVGAILAGTALAAGLIALLATSGKKSGTAAAKGVAAIDADYNKVTSAARTDAKLCMEEAARQVGATGGTRVRLDRVDRAQASGGGWMIVAPLTGTYDGKAQSMTMDCRTSGGKVSAFEVR